MSDSNTTSPGKSRRSVLILIFLLTFTGFSNANEHSGTIKVTFGDTVYPLGFFDMKRAESMFYGIAPVDGKGKTSCAECHYTQYIDTLNWNPSAYDIAAKYEGKDAQELQKVVNSPVGTKMTEVHAGYQITEEQAVLLQAFLDRTYEKGPPEEKPHIEHLFFFILACLIGFVFTIDLTLTHKIPYKGIHLTIVLLAAIYIFKVWIVEGIHTGRQQNYQPLQPIKFSHKIHAGDNKIDCQYCHNIAERSKHAGIPGANVCMNCHVIIREGKKSGKFEINKLITAYENKTPIQWVKIHNLPDYVFFSHAQHIGAGKLECQECHGAIETMDVVHQVNTLAMGWCLNCHRTKKVDFDNNKYYGVYKEFHKKMAEGKMDSVLVKDIGGTNCGKCHY